VFLASARFACGVPVAAEGVSERNGSHRCRLEYVGRVRRSEDRFATTSRSRRSSRARRNRSKLTAEGKATRFALGASAESVGVTGCGYGFFSR